MNSRSVVTIDHGPIEVWLNTMILQSLKRTSYTQMIELHLSLEKCNIKLRLLVDTSETIITCEQVNYPGASGRDRDRG